MSIMDSPYQLLICVKAERCRVPQRDALPPRLLVWGPCPAAPPVCPCTQPAECGSWLPDPDPASRTTLRCLDNRQVSSLLTSCGTAWLCPTTLPNPAGNVIINKIKFSFMQGTCLPQIISRLTHSYCDCCIECYCGIKARIWQMVLIPNELTSSSPRKFHL